MSFLARRLMTAVAGEGGDPGTPPAAPSDGYHEPFLDQLRLASTSGLTFAVNKPTKDGDNPLLPTSADTGEWDEDKLFVSVTKIDSTWHMHYKGWDGTVQHVGYASSSDGETWTKPNLGIHSYGGNTDNNIILEALFSQSHYDDISGKWVYVTEDEGTSDDLFIYTADDPNTAPSLVKTISASEVVLAEAKSIVRRPSDDRWVLYYVSGHTTNSRSIYAFVSDTTDLTGTWTKHGLVLSSPASTNQYYSIGPSRRGDFLYGLVSRYNSSSEQLWIDLFRSVDGLHWTEIDTNWIPLGSAASWDDEMVWLAGRITDDGAGGWHVYYSGSPEAHDAAFARDSRIGRTSVTAGRIGEVSGTGVVTTRPIAVAAGATLTVNCDASGGGTLDIEIQDSDGTPITNFAEADFDTITTDETGATPTWSSMEMPDDQTIRLKFVLASATLYSFDISDAATAEAPLAVPDLQSWLDASQLTGYSDGNTIAQWDNALGLRDEAGNAINYSEPTYQTAILNGRPVIRFNGSNQALYWITPKTPGFTIFAVAKQDDTGSIVRYFSSYDGGGALAAAENILDVLSGAYRFNSGGSAITGGSEDTDPHYLTWRAGANGRKIRKDGSDVASTGTAYNTTPLQFYIAEDRISAGGANEYFDGDMAEVLFFDRELSDSEVTQVEAYLAAKYGL